ncbi:hypothetical protein RFI_30419 [Reticulomyxa filosa]|uniref:Uncharacterized protein n=1 Tax=Reticulomyxa filosa TaxID=46433 RepID=X6LZE3_RETFI|nr:hypothetical protein RFI_30419 [Reticulomyxa filosa]|eukprot:ETO06974.1 hypothetical protein RFI_30419 [Reticulomyxa filosa]
MKVSCDSMKINAQSAEAVKLHCTFPNNRKLALYCPEDVSKKCEVDCDNSNTDCNGISVYRTSALVMVALHSLALNPLIAKMSPFTAEVISPIIVSLKFNKVVSVALINLKRTTTQTPTTLTTTTTEVHGNATYITPQQGKKSSSSNMYVIIGVSVGVSVLFILCCAFLTKVYINSKKSQNERDATDIVMTERKKKLMHSHFLSLPLLLIDQSNFQNFLFYLYEQKKQLYILNFFHAKISFFLPPSIDVVIINWK